MIAAVIAKRSARFPGKHMATLCGETLIGHLIGRLVSTGIFSDVLIFTKDQEVRDSRATVLRDPTEGMVMDSIETLVNLKVEVFVFAGDMPIVSVPFITEMLSIYDGTPIFPVHSGGLIEPLHGIYNRRMLSFMPDKSASADRSLKGWIGNAGASMIRIPLEYEDSFFNVNTESDIEIIRKKIGC